MNYSDIKDFLTFKKELLSLESDYVKKKIEYTNRKTGIAGKLYSNITEMLDLYFSIENKLIIKYQPSNYHNLILTRSIQLNQIDIIDAIESDSYCLVMILINNYTMFQIKVPFDINNKQKFLDEFEYNTSEYIIKGSL